MRVRMFRALGSGTKGGRLRCVDIAEAGRGEVMDWAHRVESEGIVGSMGSEEEDIVAIENKSVERWKVQSWRP